MPKRSFFYIRHTIPGFTFILYFIFQNLIAFSLLSKRIAESNSIALMGIFFGFITLLSGAALGFLVSQPWYLLNIAIKRIPYHYVNKKIKGEKLSISEQDYKVLTCNKKEVQEYIFRRWDLFNSMGSVIVAGFLGAVIGWFMSSAFNIPIEFNQNFTNSVIISQISCWIWIFSGIIIFSLIINMILIAKENVEMIVLAIEEKKGKVALKNKNGDKSNETTSSGSMN